MAKILFLIDDYLPGSTRVAAKMFHELALELQITKGHEVVVLTPSENTKIEVIDGIKVIKFKSGKVKDVSKLKRLINESLLSDRAWAGINKLEDVYSFDGVVCYSPSIFWGKILQKLKCPKYLVLRDFFPQWAVDSGLIKKGSLIERYFRYYEKKLYNSVDRIGVMSKANLSLFEKLHGKRYNSEVLNNWASLFTAPIDNWDFSERFRDKLNLNDKVIFLYGGNIGHAQDMPALMRLVESMRHVETSHFLFVGQGDEVAYICDTAKNLKLSNFTYIPSISQDEFRSLLSEVDVGLLSLSSLHTTHNFPGKILGYMAYSKPILGWINPNNDLKDIILNHHAGFIIDDQDDISLYRAALELSNNIVMRKEMGMNARILLEKEFSVMSAAEQIKKSLGLSSE